MQEQQKKNAETWTNFRLRSTFLPRKMKYIENSQANKDRSDGNLVQKTFDYDDEYAILWRLVFANISKDIILKKEQAKLRYDKRKSIQEVEVQQEQPKTKADNPVEKKIVKQYSNMSQAKKSAISVLNTLANVGQSKKDEKKITQLRFWIHVVCTLCWVNADFLCFLEFLKRIRRYTINVTLGMQCPLITSKSFLPDSYIQRYIDTMKLAEHSIEQLLHLISQIENVRGYLKRTTNYKTIIHLAQNKDLLRQQIRFLDSVAKVMTQHGGCLSICAAISMILNIKKNIKHTTTSITTSSN